MARTKKVTLKRVLRAIESDEYVGFCVKCGDESYGVEPDAREYKCENCGEHAVYGAEEMIISQTYHEQKR